MAKARGNKLVPPANYSRNPMSFNPANQGLDFSGLLALYGENRPSQQTGRNPRLTTPNTPLVSNSMMPYRGPSAVDMAGDRASAAQIRNSANQINSLIARSQAANPMVPRSPGFGVVDPATESTRRLAPMLAQDAARQQNTPMNGMTAYEANPMRYRPGDPAIQARQLDNAQRATMGQPMDRTRDSGALNAYISSGGTPWYERERQARDQMAMQARQSTPEFQAAMAAMQQQKTAREALRDRSNLNVPQAELDRRDAADTARREREARHNQFKDASGGMNYKQYDRLQRQNALTMKAVDEGRLSPEAANFRMRTRADKALRRAGNPMAMGDANRGRLFPDMFAGKGGRAASTTENPIVVGGRTLEAQQAAAADIVNRESTSPHIAGLGVEPGSGLAGLNQKISSRILEDPNAEFSDESLREFQQHAAQYETIATDQNDPFAFGTGQYGPDAGVESKQAALWRELAKLPDNPRSRAEWLKKYKSIKPDPEPDPMGPANQQPSPFQSPEKPMYRGGNPMYTPRLPIRTGV